ncbi:MAG: DUF3141 domain-containing protein [Geminicoccaceae bacterium]
MMLDPLSAYMVDAVQRNILFLDVLRRRGNQYREYTAEIRPNVLEFSFEIVMDGRKLPRPANYWLARIKDPSTGTTPTKRPVIVVDPRAGHGPGIGGFKPDSEIGMSLKAGHPVYFVGFLPEPCPGQTIEDVMQAEAAFIERVVALHPDAEGKPIVIGNCQAGWVVMMLAAAKPELIGPVIVAGAPLSYWAGVHGKNPMRYTGGLLGGSWLTALTSDLGDGIFDGSWLVSNFEKLNPSNTLWSKQYNLWANIDSEGERYLAFEKWWNAHVELTAAEMQWIVDNLFVGNRLSAGEIMTSDGVRLDLRNVRGPVICFCSQGDNITPPQQALGWILDCYDDVDDIRAHGQTIVYSIHENIGHLGIFVSTAVAKKEHAEFTSNIDLIDCLPPGLYEAVITPKSEHKNNLDLAPGDFVMRIEARDLDHIRALGGNDIADERRFATAARLSDINLGLYRTFVQPWLRAMVTSQTAETLRRLRWARFEHEVFSDANPFMKYVGELAGWVRANRMPVDKENPLVAAQERFSERVVKALDDYRDRRDEADEANFLQLYATPALQAMVGLKGSTDGVRPRFGTDPDHVEFVQHKIAELKASMAEGGPRAAALRAMLYVRMGDGFVDERDFNMLQQIRREHAPDIGLMPFKQMLRGQFARLVVDAEAAVDALPHLMRGFEDSAPDIIEAVRQVVTASGALSPEGQRRLDRVQRVLGTSAGEAGSEPAKSAEPAPVVARPRPRPVEARTGAAGA